MSEVDAQKPKENPLTNIMVNVLIPILALSYLSKDPAFVDKARPWHIGPTYALLVALALPVGYGIWFYLKHRQPNFFSVMGLVSVLLTGGLTLLLWNKDGTVNSAAPILFGLKEASIPFLLGLAVFASHWTKTPLLNTFLYNDQIFDLKKIESRIGNETERYRKLLFTCTIIFAVSFLISTVLNFLLAQYFLGGGKIDFESNQAREQYNGAVAKLTGWGFVVIGVPIMGMLFYCLQYLLKGLREITGLETEEILLPR
ncbi:MAG: VC0807 family protein [Verrucomicrobiota bacterium JB023]|nr:VC0807 family protein [Verrucomicrobiota bacterium JB023]